MVYNSPSFHITGVAMFSCVLMSLGFDVTAVIKVKACSRHVFRVCMNCVCFKNDELIRLCSRSMCVYRPRASDAKMQGNI